MNALFVYGTLRKGGSNAGFLKGAECIGMGCAVEGELHATPYDYPIARKRKGRFIQGELYNVSADMLKAIDRLEGYEEGRQEGNEYERVVMDVVHQDEVVQAYGYIATDFFQQIFNPIESGDWITYVKENKKLPKR